MIRVLLIDANQGVRKGLAALLQTQPDIDVVAQATTGIYALLLTRFTQPDFVLMDLYESVKDTAVIQQMKAIQPHIRIFITATQYDGAQMQQVVQAGATGFLPKPIAAKTLFQIIRQETKPATLDKHTNSNNQTIISVSRKMFR